MTYLITNLTEALKVKRRIEEFQNNSFYEPFSCGLSENHGLLQPVIITLSQENDRHQVILRCVNNRCKFEHHFIPDFLLRDDH